MSKGIQSIETYRQAAEIHRIATRAVRKAQEESRRLNVPNVYSWNGQLYYDRLELVKTADESATV
jgi:hypothetical protein